MAAVKQTVEHVASLEKYKHGFVSDIEQDFARFRKAYANITPKFPEKMSPIKPLAPAAGSGAPQS